MRPLSDWQLGLRRRRVPVILQQQRSECGLASLAMVAAAHGKQLTLTELRRDLPASAGSTLDDLVRAADGLQLLPRPLRLELDELPRLRLPAILHWRLDHFVVLVRCGRRVVIHDPAAGRCRLRQRELHDAFTGIALELRPAAGFREEVRGERLTFSALLRSIRGLGRYLAGMLALLLTAQALSLLPPIATQLLIDEVVLGQQKSWLMAALAGLGAVMLAGVVIEALRRWIALYAGTRIATDCTLSVVRHLLRLPGGFLRQRHLGDLMSKLESLQPVRQALTETAINGVVQLTVLLTTIAIMAMYSVTLTAIALAGVLLSGSIMAALLPASRRLSGQILVHSARQRSSLIESLRGVDVVAALGIDRQRFAHFETQLQSSMNAAVRQKQLGIWGAFGNETVNALEQIAFLAVGIGQLLDSAVTLGVLFAFLSLRGRLRGSFTSLAGIVQSLNLLRVHLDRLADLVLAEARPLAVAGCRRAVRGSLELRGVTFCYPGGPPVFRELDGCVAAGSTTVITGPSGCGKTSLLRVLAGLEAPTRGTLLLDGLEWGLWDAAYLRERIGVVLQDDLLFQGTIADNICGFDPLPDPARMRAAAVTACIWADIQRLPMQSRTSVGDMGSTLSGGQRQRIVLARALYRQPRLLLLDEATSNLDVPCERRVLGNLKRLDMTILSVAHRPDAVRQAAQIIRLGQA